MYMPKGKTRPAAKGWNTFDLGVDDIPKYFNNGNNIGLHLKGEGSMWLTDVDIDSDFALKIAPSFLPETKMKSGYDSRPESHWWYICEDSSLVQLNHPELPDNESMIIEIRSKNRATVCPPSIRPDFQRIKWYGSLEPTKVSFDELKRKVCLIAVITIFSGFWKEGARNSISQALAGAYAYCGKDISEALDFIGQVCHVFEDEESEARFKNVIDTYAKYKENKNITGFPTFKDIIGEKSALKVKEWLNLQAMIDLDKMKPASTIISDEAQKYYQFAFCSDDGIFSTRFNRFVPKSAFKEAFNDEVLKNLKLFSIEAVKTKKDGTKYTIENRGMPSLFKDFSPIAYQKLIETLPHSAPISGLSTEGNRFFITGSNGIWEIVNCSLVKSERISIKSGDSYEVTPDKAFTNPILIFNGIRSIVEKFNWANSSTDPSIFALYMMYLSVWECIGQKIHAIITGGTGSGKTALTCLIATPTTNEGDPLYRGYGLIPHSIRAKSDSTVSGIQKLMRGYPHCCLVLDEGEMDQEGARIGKILDFLRGAAGGGEVKFRGGNWHNDDSYPPTILSGIHIYIDEVDSSRFLLFDLLPPAEGDEPVMTGLHKIRPLRNTTVTELLTSLIPYVPAIKAYIDGHITNNRTENLYLPLMAILNTVLRPHLKDNTAELIENRIAELAKATRESIKQDCSGRQRISEIINHVVRIGSEDTSLLRFSDKNINSSWEQFGPYQAWVKRGCGDESVVAFKYEYLYQIKYDIAWTKTLKSDSGFSRWCKKNQIGSSSVIRCGPKLMRVIEIDSTIFSENDISDTKEQVSEIAQEGK